ncbi:MAG: ABC transporter substrate-binding protein [Candidatus Hadarchaeia archaeon]
MFKRKSLKFSVVSMALALAFLLSVMVPLVTAQEEDEEFVDEIQVEVRSRKEAGLGDTATGQLDAFMTGVSGDRWEGLREDWQDVLGRMDSYGSYTNLLFNPAATEKYTVEKDGEYYFNPYSIQQVRYAMNWLVDREEIVQEIYNGHAEPRYLSVESSHPGWDERFASIVEESDISAAGDLDRARDMVTEAMEEAMNDSELVGDLDKIESDDSPVGYWWAYRGPNEDEFEPIEINIIERLDEREEIGGLFASALEEVGLQPNERPLDRGPATDQTLYADPAEVIDQWNVYTSGWTASGAYYYNEWSAYQMYADFYGYMPGGQAGPDAWKYGTPEINEVTQPLSTGELENEEEYWQRFREGVRLGLEDGVRVFLATTIEYWPYNNERLLSHVEDIKTGWSNVFTPRTAKTPDGELKTAQYSDAGELFMDDWNRIAGETDTYSMRMLEMIRDYAVIGNPTTGRYMPMRAEWSDINRDVDFGEDGTEPQIEIPDNAVFYDTQEKEWKNVSEDTMASSSVTYDYKFSKWHDGHMMDDQDLVAWWAFAKEWAYQDGEDDSQYQSTWSGQVQPTFEKVKGVEWHGDGEVTIYGDYTFPVDSQIASFYGGLLDVFVPWQVNYAADRLIVSDEASPVQEQHYSWEGAEGTAGVHYLSEEQGQDYQAVLEDISAEGEIPPYLQEQNNSPFPMDESGLSEEIESINSFYDEYGHYYDSNGTFAITDYNPGDMVMTLERFTNLVEDAQYPFAEDHWTTVLRRSRLSLGSLDIPSNVDIGDAINIQITAEEIQEFPEQTSNPAESGSVTLEITTDGESVYNTEAELIEPGLFEFSVPVEETEQWEAGSYEFTVRGALSEQTLDEEEISKTVVLENPEDFSLSNLSLSARTVEVGETVDISVDVTNNGAQAGDYDVELLVDGDSEDIETVSLGAEETQTVEFSTSRDEAGSYTVEIGDLSTSFDVEESEEGFNTTLIVVAVVIVIIVVAIAAYFKSKRS